MSNFRRHFSQILTENVDGRDEAPETWDFAEDIASALYERLEHLPPISTWAKPVQHFYACYDLNFQVGNGGFAQAAYNVPELFPLAKEAYEQMQRIEAAALLDRALQLLPAELKSQIDKGLTYSDDIEAVFSHFTESQLAELDEEIPDEFWFGNELEVLVVENRIDFEALD